MVDSLVDVDDVFSFGVDFDEDLVLAHDLCFFGGKEEKEMSKSEDQSRSRSKEGEKDGMDWNSLFSPTPCSPKTIIPLYLDDLADVGAWLLQELELLAEEADCFVLVGDKEERGKRR